MTAYGDGDKDPFEPNHSSLRENVRVKENIVANEQNLTKQNGLTSNGDLNDVRDGLSGPAKSQAMLQIQAQPQPQVPTVHWERFLHLRSLKVLLVENDYSTCHVVSALLRNCSYEVTEASNALQAWKILEDLANHIDLVLSEVSLPSLSGIVLLSKIMSHKTRKNIPVIMMSSHDSMGLVFKCLSKGAVDFLVKPIRKNELKNLWQHVWRRCHSSSGSGSESGTQSQKSVSSKNIERSGNNTGSNDEDENGSAGLNMGDGSDNGSGTQSSWTKQAAEIESPQPSSPWNHVVECADSTCAQVIRSHAETSQNKQVPAIAARKCEEIDELPENVAVGSEFELGMSRSLEQRVEHPMDVLHKAKGSKLKKGLGNFNDGMGKGKLELFSESPSNKVLNETPSLTGVIVSTDIQTETREFEGPSRISSVSDVNNIRSNNAENLPSLELSLKRLRAVIGVASKGDRNVLRRSDSSAFSRYNTSSNACKNTPANSGSGLLNENSMKAKEVDLKQDVRSHSNGEPPNQCSNWGSNNIDMDSTTNRPRAMAPLIRSNSVVTSTVKRLNAASCVHPLKAEVAFPEDGDKDGTAVVPQIRGMEPKLQMEDPRHHHDKQVASDHDDLSLKLLATPAPHCGSSNVLGGVVEGNAWNYSVNGSASGSNHGSNGLNGSSFAANAGGMNMESDNGNAGKSGSTNASGSGSGSGNGSGNNRVDQNKFSQREAARQAALRKFRQKRSERCFHKKVRYQSRKKLAEQRPRVRGQFVRKSADENTSAVTNR